MVMRMRTREIRTLQLFLCLRLGVAELLSVDHLTAPEFRAMLQRPQSTQAVPGWLLQVVMHVMFSSQEDV